MNAAVERLFAKEIDAKWTDGIAKGRAEGERNATDLMNYLWSHGRGEEAQKASSDKDLFNKLLAEFKKTVTSAAVL